MMKKPVLVLILAWACLTAQTLTAKEIVLRIGLGTYPTLTVSFPQGGEMVSTQGRSVKRFRSGERFTWQAGPVKPPPKGRSRPRKEKNPTRNLTGKAFRFRPLRGDCVCNDKVWRGTLQIAFSQTGAQVVNEVALEDYVRGVVGAEVGSKSPPETLKAQAVIARTYAVANRGKHGKAGFDLCNREHCQVYGGVKAERPSIDPAVQTTRGIIMTCDGHPITTMYHATCGGMTSDNEKVYGGAPTTYLRRVKCPFCKKGLNYRWNRTFSVADLQKGLAPENLRFQTLRNATVDSPAPLDRVDWLKLETERGTLKVKGTTFRRLLNLPSTTFVVESSSGPGSALTPSSSPKGSGENALPPASPLKGSGEPLSPGRKGTTRIQTGPLAQDPGQGPAILFVQSQRGLRRQSRPAGGWQVIMVKAGPSLDTPSRGRVPLRQEAGLSSLTLLGRGYGHQVGLCQSGAVELGKRNWSYRQILAHYYTKVALRRLP